jgi:hypothetical protein
MGGNGSIKKIIPGKVHRVPATRCTLAVRGLSIELRIEVPYRRRVDEWWLEP